MDLLFADIFSFDSEFVNKFYPEVKTHNPKLPILIRECSGVKPRIWARFEFGKESSLEASNKSPDDVMSELIRLVETGDK